MLRRLPRHQLQDCFAGGRRILRSLRGSSQILLRAAGDAETVAGFADALEVLQKAHERSPRESKALFRQLCKKLHPDVAGNSVEARKRFEDVVDAYQLVSTGSGMSGRGRSGGTRKTATAPAPAPERPRWWSSPPWTSPPTPPTPKPSVRQCISGVTKRDAFKEKVRVGDVVIFRLRQEDRQTLGIAANDQLRWGLAVILSKQFIYTETDPGGFLSGQRLVFEGGKSTARYRDEWLVVDNDADSVLINPLNELEVLFAYRLTSYGGAPTEEDELHELRYKLGLPVDTSSVFADVPPTMVDRQIRLSVKGHLPGAEIMVRLKKSTPLSKLMSIYCRRLGLEESEVCFVFRGERLGPEDTAEGLGLQDQDLIDVYV